MGQPMNAMSAMTDMTDLTDAANGPEMTNTHPSSLALKREAADLDTPPERLAQLAAERTLRPLVAGNPATPPATLKRLARTTNRALRAEVAANPNTPVEVLFELAGEFPAEVVGNPALDLHMVAYPELPGRMARELSAEALCALLRCEDAPLALLRLLRLSSHDAVRALAGLHVQIVGEPGADVLPEVLTRARNAFRAALADVPFGEPEIVCDLPGMMAPWFVELLLGTPHVERMLRSPDTSPEVLVRLAWSASPHALLLIAAHPHTPERLLVQLALHSEPEVRRAVASNPATPTRILSDLADTRHESTRLAVAKHPSASAATLAELARDHNPTIRSAVARNPSTPAALLRQLAAAVEPEVRGAAQRHLPMSPQLLAYLAEDRNPLRRRAVAGHPDTAPKTLLRLASDRDPLVRINVARHPRVPPEVLIHLSRDPQPAVRAAVAEHPALPPHERRRMELDADPDVRAHLARNPEVPFTTLKRLWIHTAEEHLHEIAAHPAVTPERRGQLYTRLCADQLRQFRGAPTMVRLAALASDLLPVASYEAGAGSRHWLDRYVVASNPSAPLSVLEALAHDGIVYVRAAARANLAARSQSLAPAAAPAHAADPQSA